VTSADRHSPAIRAEGFSVRYPDVAARSRVSNGGGNRGETGVRQEPKGRLALQPLDLVVRPGERVLLLGPSGSGKSTLVSCLVGLVPHSTYAEIDGELIVDGRSIRDHQPDCLSRSVGVVFQDPDSQLTMLTVEDEVAFGLENLGVDPADMDQRTDEALGAVGLHGLRHERVDRLSGGMKQRLVIAALLAMQPKILVLDEPTSNLDPAGVRDLADLLARLCRERTEMTLVLVEHRLDAVAPLVGRVVVLDAFGNMAIDAPPAEAFGVHAARLAGLNVWLPTEASARLAAASGRLEEWSAPRRGIGGCGSDCGGGTGYAAGDGYDGGTADATVDAAVVLSVEGVCFSYRPDKPVLRDVSLQLHRGEICAVLGANGSGKTTLASLAVGLHAPDRGRVLFDGRPVARIAARELAGRVGFVFQNPEHQFVTDSVIDEVRFNMCDVSEQAVARTLAALRLEIFTERNPFTLSHGQKRRLSAATMLVAPKELLVLDEPTFGQDPSALEELLQMLDTLAEAGTAVIMVTHDMDLVWRRADRMVVMHHGEILADGDPQVLFADTRLLERAGVAPPAVAAFWTAAGGSRTGSGCGEVSV
jgi:energy-coupling factor transport system ATP-binding protein